MLLLASASAYTLVTQVTPVQKVLEMMGEMKVKGVKLKNEEAATFKKYADWAKDQQTELGFEIKTGTSEIEKLTASVKSSDLDVEKLGKQMSGLNKEINRMKKTMKEASEQRQKERMNYMKTQQDLAESVEAIEKAASVVSSGSQDKEQAAVLLQGMATTVPKMPLVLAAFLEEQDMGAPSAAAYASQNGGISTILDGLQTKFKKELNQCQKEESNKAHAYNLLSQHLSDAVKDMKGELSEKVSAKGKTSAESAKAGGELASTKAELASDKKMLAEVGATLRTKTIMFQGNQKTRKNELEALDKAIQIISSPDVSKGGKFTQVTSLLQTKTAHNRVAGKRKVLSFLDQQADLLSSTTLKDFTSEVSSSPFAKVNGLIKGLISKLKEEAAAEAKHNQWCGQQLKANKRTRNTQNTKSEKLEAGMEKLSGTIATHSQLIATLAAEQAALSKAMAKATGIRSEEKKRNSETMSDAVKGANAVKQALSVLRKFYSSQSFLQQGKAPKMEKYSGHGGGTSVIGMLEVIESDFHRLKAETSADEQQALREYNKFMKEATTNMAEKKSKEKKLSLDKDKAKMEKGSQAKDYKATTEKLKAANKYLDYLKPTCMEVDVDFSDRSKRRKEEIKALKEAYGVLDEKGDE